MKINSRDAVNYIGAQKPFQGFGALRAVTIPEDSCYLTGDDREQWEKDVGSMVYIVYSYRTPIAWVTSRGTKYRVQGKFSVTTSRHQSKLYKLFPWNDSDDDA